MDDVLSFTGHTNVTCAEKDFACAKWAQCLDGFFPCSLDVWGNFFLLIVYGLILAKGSKTIADGSELLMEVLDPGFIGGFVLPVLGALPDATIILVSCLGPNLVLVQEQVTVGIGALAGSTIMLLTIPWIGGVFLGRCDIVNGKAKDKVLTRRFDLTGTGVECETDIKKQAMIMIATSFSYLVIQGIAFGYINKPLDVQRSHEKWFALAAFICSSAAFVAFSVYMVLNTKLQKKRMEEARQKYIQERVITTFVDRMKARVPPTLNNENTPLLGTDDVPDNGSINPAVAVDVKRIGLKWKKKAEEKREERLKKEVEEEAEEEEEKSEDIQEPKSKIALRSVAMMLIGTLVVALFSDPMVDTITQVASLLHVKNFYVAFIIVPITSNASELIASLIFAAKKRKKNISLTFGAIYGAVCMNNTLCLTVFLAMIFFRGLVWEFSAEVVSILFVTATVGIIGATRTVFPLYYIFIIGLLYPASIGLVAFLESPIINWR